MKRRRLRKRELLPFRLRLDGGRQGSRRICMVVYAFYENDTRVMQYADALVERGDHVDVIALRRALAAGI